MPLLNSCHFIVDGCPKAYVLHTKHNDKGDTGEFFYFSDVYFDKMVGHSRWNSRKFEVFQQGSQNWTGYVKVWNNNYGIHGRRDSGSNQKQWKRGDTIQLKACIDKGIRKGCCF